MFRTRQTSEFAKWFEESRDLRAKSRIAARIVRVEAGNLGDCKALGGSISELRIDSGPGYRIYFMIRDQTLVILLCGGDKHPSAAISIGPNGWRNNCEEREDGR